MSNYELMSRKTFVTWEMVDEFVDKLTDEIKHKTYCGVYGIPKGGLPLAVMVAYRANLPLLMAPQPGCLVVDEITATGKALENYAGRYDIATMYYFNDSTVKPNYFHRIIFDEWMVFPWE